ncbi:hypothetical protein HQ571_02005 [Candidatus Kuenenbacteria bacterium]|nr:hypothetical protein [Candidatus Kuenenbacteria bacterium]
MNQTKVNETIAGYSLQTLEDGQRKVLCFATAEDAIRFKKFSNMYMEESGAGNGYGAYWVFINAEINGVTKIEESFACDLKTNLLNSMRNDIVTARTAGEFSGDDIDISVDKKNGALTFQIGNFPERQRPQKGDMFRSLFSYKGDKTEGRVIEDNGDMLKVIACWDEDDYGDPKPNATFIDISADDTIKINDWKIQFRKRRQSRKQH